MLNDSCNSCHLPSLSRMVDLSFVLYQCSASLEELASADGDRLSTAVIRAPLIEANVVSQIWYALESFRCLCGTNVCRRAL